MQMTDSDFTLNDWRQRRRSPPKGTNSSSVFVKYRTVQCYKIKR